MDYSPFIGKVLEKASKLALGYFGKVSGTTKADDNNQVLTEADIAIGKMIIQEISTTYPEHNIIDEEAGVIDHGSEYTWVVDPIDGTSNFAEGIVTYGIILGLLKNNVPIAGGVALPSFSEIYLAEKGKGAFCNGEKLSVTTKDTLLSTLVVYGLDGQQENPEFTRKEAKLMGEIILNIRNLRTSGSVFDAMMLAKGKYGAYMVQTVKIWDNVGVQPIIEEAGGVFTDFFGKPMDYSNALKRTKENFPFCAGPAQLHQQIQEIIHKYY